MRRLILIISLFAAFMSTAGVSARADVVAHVVSESNGEITLNFTNTGPTQIPVARFFVVLPTTGNYSVSFAQGPAVKVEEPPLFADGIDADSLRTRLAAQQDTVRTYAPVPFRGVRLLYVEFDLYLVPGGGPEMYRLVSPTVTVSYDPAPEVNDAASADPFVRNLVANENVFPRPERPAPGADPWFSLAGTWVKIPVALRGVYAVSGDDLIALGVDLSGINNPSTMRMYSTLGSSQSRDLTDPDATWRRGNAMEEVAILVEDGGDGTFDRGDRVLFYGVAASDWADYYDPAAPDTVYRQHPRTTTNYYYLTWDGMLPGTPRRMASVYGPPGAGGDVTTYEARLYAEEDHVPDFDYRGDGWLWVEVPGSGEKQEILSDVIVSNLDPSRPQTFRSVGLAPYDAPDLSDGDPPNLNDHTTRYLVRRGGGTAALIGESRWTTQPGERFYEDGVPIRHDGFFLGNTTNRFVFQIPKSPENPNPDDFGYFAWFSLHYHRLLRAAAERRGFSAPDTAGTVTFAVDGFSSTAGARVFDVTDMRAPVRVTGVAAAGGTLRFSAAVAGRRHFWAAAAGGLGAPPGMTLLSSRDIRADGRGPNMVIVTHEAFRAAAERLRAHRQSHLPGYVSPVVKVVTTEEIYDSFSGGMRDAMAIRNYVKFLYDNYGGADGNPSLGYVLLFGDANEDIAGAVTIPEQNDYVPSNLFFTTRSAYAFVTDEWFGHLDVEDQVGGRAVLDVAIGRLPAASPEEAATLADKVIAYETAAPYGPWRKEVVLVSDDEIGSNPSSCEPQFTYDSETICYEHVAEFLEVRKVYLTEFDRIGLIKPAARARFLDVWNDGALLINYIGHGSNRQMADEQVFVDSDVTLLDNGMRLPVLFALSCTIGDFANYRLKSLSEKLLLRREGGVVGTVTASRETYATNNRRLNLPLFDRVTARRASDPAPTLGQSLMEAKLISLPVIFNDPRQEDNNWKYNLLADPAMRLATPRREIRFDMPASDSLVAGLRKTLRGGVYAGGGVDATFNGEVRVKVREPEVKRIYETECTSGATMQYRVPGGVLFEGTADAVDGRFEFSFRVPRSASRGPLAFLTGYADDGTVDAVATLDSTLTLVSPTAADSTGLRALDGPPRVALGFKSGLETVKPGETLQAVVHDADGINILDTTNEGKQAIVFDDLPVPIDVNEFFEFDHGGADTSGVLLFPLPELEFGEHRAIYKVSDAFGQTALDTLTFNVTDPRDFFAEVLLNYPNPFTDDTSFLIRLSDAATIQLDIYTVTGRRVRRLEAVRGAGEVWIPWDGRDAHGGRIANGVYLYVATVDFTQADRPALELRGKLAKIE